MSFPRLGMLALVAIGVLAGGCQINQADTSANDRRPTVERDAPAYRLGSGDKLRVGVYNEDSMSGEYEVDGSGNLSLKLMGSIKAKGLTVEQLAAEVENQLRLGRYLKDPRVSVEVLNYRPFYVLGEVKEPGKYPFVNGMTVLNAVALAGGYTYRARENNVIIIRGSDPGQRERKGEESSAIMPGDIIRVPERMF